MIVRRIAESPNWRNFQYSDVLDLADITCSILGSNPPHTLYLSLQGNYTREGLHAMDLLTVLEIYHYKDSFSACNNDYITAFGVRTTPRGCYAYPSFLRSRGEIIVMNSGEESGGLPTFSVRDISQFLPTAQRSSSDRLVRALSFPNSPLPLWELVALVYSMKIVFLTYKNINNTLNPYGALIVRALEAVCKPNVLIENAKIGEEMILVTKNSKNKWIVLEQPNVKKMDISPLLNQFQKAKNAFKQPILDMRKSQEMDKQYLEAEIARLQLKLKELNNKAI